MMVGDGSTDLDAAPVVDLFVAYAGVVQREIVMSAADVTIRTQSLAPVFTMAINDNHAAALPPGARSLYNKGASILRAMENK
jgi:hypothetical protein